MDLREKILDHLRYELDVVKHGLRRFGLTPKGSGIVTANQADGVMHVEWRIRFDVGLDSKPHDLDETLATTNKSSDLNAQLIVAAMLGDISDELDLHGQSLAASGLLRVYGRVERAMRDIFTDRVIDPGFVDYAQRVVADAESVVNARYIEPGESFRLVGNAEVYTRFLSDSDDVQALGPGGIVHDFDAMSEVVPVQS